MQKNILPEEKAIKISPEGFPGNWNKSRKGKESTQNLNPRAEYLNKKIKKESPKGPMCKVE